MSKKSNVIIYVLLVLITILLLWLLLKDRVFDKELIFKVDENIEIKIGNNELIKYELNEELNIFWESENESVAKVNNGVVTGVGLGSTNIKATIEKKKQKTTRVTKVSTYYGDKESNLNEIIVPEGELFITKGDSYEIPISYNPNNGYIKSIEYNVTNSNIVDFDGKVIAKEVGETTITITVNNNISKSIIVNVIGNKINPVFSKKVENVIVNKESITLNPNKTQQIDYEVEPSNSFIKSIKWESSNPSIATVDDGVVLAKSLGEAIIKLTINDEITKEIKVIVNIPVTALSLLSNPNLVLKVGQTETIKTSIVPANATNKTLKYESTGGVSIDNSGVITATSPAAGTITIKTIDGNYKKTISYVVNPKIGVVNNVGGIWGYTSQLDKVPTRADASFFQRLASSGKGVLSGNIYTYNDGKTTYRYDISKSSLSDGSKTVLTRIYYPEGVDLSKVNTFTFCNGTGSGAVGFSGILNSLDKDRTQMKTSGIIILIASSDGKGYNQKGIILATEFVKSIVNQKPGVKNAVGAYSGSGEAVGYAGHNSNYDRVVIFNSYLKVSYNENLKNREIIVYSPNNDKLQDATKSTLNNMIRHGFTNVTVISNNSSIINDSKFRSNFLIVNPGKQMGSGHGYVNIPPTNVFSYACR